MSQFAESLSHERMAARPPGLPPAEAEPAPIPAPVGELPFRPEVFFLGRTEGAGVTRDVLDRVVRRFTITTTGVFDPAHRAIHFDETFAYDDGEVELWRWVMAPGRGGRYVAAEARAGAGIAGERRGPDYLISFRRPHGKARGLLAPHFSARFTLLAPDIALRRANVSLLGVPVGALHAVHRRLEN